MILFVPLIALFGAILLCEMLPGRKLEDVRKEIIADKKKEREFYLNNK